MKKKIFLIILNLLLLLPNVSPAVTCNGTDNGLNLCYPAFTIGTSTFTLTLNMPLNQIIAWFYYFIIGIAGLSAFVMLVWGGFQYLSSAGNPTAISDAKDRIKSALLGLLIILTSWLILQVINPDLTTLLP